MRLLLQSPTNQAETLRSSQQAHRIKDHLVGGLVFREAFFLGTTFWTDYCHRPIEDIVLFSNSILEVLCSQQDKCIDLFLLSYQQTENISVYPATGYCRSPSTVSCRQFFWWCRNDFGLPHLLPLHRRRLID